MQSCHTNLMFGTRGKGMEVMKKRMRTDYLWNALNPTGEHSRKPDDQYDLIMQMSKGPYLEMFARPRYDADGHEDWTYWGNEV